MRSILPLFLLIALVGCDSNDGGTDTPPVNNEVAQINSIVTVAYIGSLEDGRVFDQSQGATFLLSSTIPGFRDSVVGMRVGESKTFSIAPEDGYGASPPPSSIIPPNATLIFEVTLLDVQ